VQAEVLKLRGALGRPEALHTDVRARIEGLRRSKAQQTQRLEEVRRDVAELEQQLQRAHGETAALQAELDSLTITERGLVDAAVSNLNPGPRLSSGCLGMLALLAVLLVLFA